MPNLQSIELSLLSGLEPSSINERVCHHIISQQMFYLLFDIHNAPGVSIVNQKLINIKWQNPYDVAFTLRPNRELGRMAAERITGTLRRFDLGPEGTGLEEMASLSQHLVHVTNLEVLIIDFGHPCSRVKGGFDWMCDLCMDCLHTVHFCNG